MRRVIAGFLAASLLASCGGSKKKDDAVEPSFTKAHDLKQLMAVIVQPQADVFWRSAGTVTDKTGPHELRPTTDEAWLRTQSAAATLVEIGNLMQTPLYATGRGKDWMQFSQALSQIALKAEKAAKGRASEDEIFEIGGTMYNVCSACHQAYPPAAGEIPAAAGETGADGANGTAQ
jgi:hypothetical protein